MLKVHPPQEQVEHLKDLNIFAGRGLSEEDRARSFRPHIIQNTDDGSRFADSSAFLEWARKGRILYCLTDEKFDLGGLIFFGKKHHDGVPKCDVTFAIRLYEGYVGRGLAKPFMRTAHEHVAQHYYPGLNGFWLETAVKNEPARQLYHSFGYIAVAADESSAGRIVMEYPRRESS
jgi:GNAT superfamily N-acetyltransferase